MASGRRDGSRLCPFYHGLILVVQLLQHGAVGATAINKDGLTPTHLAALSRHREIASLLAKFTPEDVVASAQNARFDHQQVLAAFWCDLRRNVDSSLTTRLVDIVRIHMVPFPAKGGGNTRFEFFFRSSEEGLAPAKRISRE